MKKLWIAAAVGCASVSGAQAQSSVTLYGRIDNGVEYMSNVGGHSRWRLASGEWGTGLFGLKGSEDLGGGNKAIFKLESGIDTSDGTAGDTNGRLYQRYAFVGIANDTYGTFTLGRMLAISNGVWDFDPFVQQAWSSASLVRSRNWNKTSNNIQYQSPNWYGIDVLGQYSLGNTTSFNQGQKNADGTFADYGRSDGIQLTYTRQYFQIRGIFDEMRDANGRFSDLFLYSREYIAMINAYVGKFKLQAAYTHMHADATIAGAPTSGDHEWGGVTYQWTPVFATTAAVFHINTNGDALQGGGRATMFEIGTTYNFSKRTFLYATAATVRNSNGANFSLEANSQTSSDNPTPGGNQSGVYVGINHSF
ncbi:MULTISPECIES: porin [Burkholderiaceae]|jgi:predicted porin|uniref:Outer membrane protein (Porin) n=1 Tax=Caballeronia sordidicola TaxID=196367 RepID=A0A242MP17_CABSO|nr:MULTISPECIES: porin [Burkholderiaceae]AMH43113.1 porin [Burkholderia sp. PAMC 26561]MDP9157507.1 porin [Pseudomonadota bacterium]OTP68455.1 Outer membrane protein (porin) [Caballeronia sordidicola]OTP73068.1 Outer membrane protein (porin) [Caballeronia sordidicola]